MKGEVTISLHDAGKERIADLVRVKTRLWSELRWMSCALNWFVTLKTLAIL